MTRKDITARYGYDYTTGEGQKRLMYESAGLTYTAPKRVNVTASGDYGCDPIGDGTFRMVPSGDIVDYNERCRRLSEVAR